MRQGISIPAPFVWQCLTSLIKLYLQPLSSNHVFGFPGYERLITFDPNRDLIHPKYHYRLTKLFEQKCWKGKAIDRYEHFLDLWKDADSGNAEVEDAKKSVVGLKK